ncbi:MAG: hypothetical protein ACKVU2_13440 [Saprospiraceae bacterium]
MYAALPLLLRLSYCFRSGGGTSFFGNDLTDLPAEIGELKKLTFLSLSGNPIPEAERERIRRLMPAGCKVYF